MFVDYIKAFLESFAPTVLSEENISASTHMDSLKTTYLESFSLFIQESLFEYPIWVDGLDNKQLQRWAIYWYIVPPYLNEQNQLWYGVELYVNAECILELSYQPSANQHQIYQK